MGFKLDIKILLILILVTTCQSNQIKKKCHPIAGGMPDLIKTEHASSSRVDDPTKKSTK